MHSFILVPSPEFILANHAVAQLVLYCQKIADCVDVVIGEDFVLWSLQQRLGRHAWRNHAIGISKQSLPHYSLTIVQSFLDQTESNML